MSGIEIAGLVLGAFPLLIQALRTYREGAEVLKDWWKIERAYKKTNQDLQYHQILFEGNVERFLLPLVVDDDELLALMADPAGKGWEDAELEVRLRQRLPKSYDLFLDIIGDISELVESLKKELGVKGKFQALVTKDGKLDKANVSRGDLLSMANMEFQAKRIKFTVRKSSRERLFGQLQDANERMRKLLESSDQITAARSRSQATTAPSIVNRKINEFWRHAKRLHEALSSAWQCGCAGHIANLGLEHRTSEKVEFDVLFHLEDDHQKLGWHGTRIKMIANADALSIRVPQPPTASTGGRVRFNITDSQEPALSTDQITQITDLGKALASSCPDCIGFLDADEHRFMLYPGNRTAAISQVSTISLHELLCNAHSLTRTKRYFLALTLAASYLQLGTTPWLNTYLRKESIVFVQDLGEPQTTMLEHPYIRHEMSNQTNNPATDALSSLGIRLLELCFGTPIEANLLRKQLPAGDDTLSPLFDYTAAIQWSRLVGEEAGPEFAEAIEWCLHTKTPNENNWRADLWQHVVLPLEACHKQLSQRATFT